MIPSIEKSFLATALYFFLALCTTNILCADDSESRSLVAFGSCADDENPNHPIWNSIAEANPSDMVFMGDNVYVDSRAIATRQTQEAFEPDYERLNASPGFQMLKKIARFHATWDDHDFGANDGGREFNLKEISQSVFLNFWGVARSSPRFQTPGVHGHSWIESSGRSVQVILLDSRYFRSPIKHAPTNTKCPYRNIVPTDDPEATMLGEDQWNWLLGRLQTKADLHLIVSGIQVIPDEHCFERWGAMPEERYKLFNALRDASARAIILSGDRHLGEVSMLPMDAPNGVGYDLYEFTSSSLSASYGFGDGETNSYRVAGENVRVNNFGLIEFDWENSQAIGELRDQHGAILRIAKVPLGN